MVSHISFLGEVVEECTTNKKFGKVVLGVFCLFFFVKFLETLCFINYIDPFCYHLAFPKLWLETSFSEAMKDNDLFLFAGYFDFLYVIPMYLFRGDYFLIQKIGQGMHFFFSIGLGSLLLKKYFKNRVVALLAGLTLLTISKSATFFLVAKNDGALSLAILFCFIIIFDDKFVNVKGLKRAALIGAVLGLIPAIKLNGICYAIPLAIFFVIKNRKTMSNILVFSISGIAIFSPILWKNWIFIKNPLFPALLTSVPGEATEVMVKYYTKYLGAEFEWSLLLEHLNFFLLGKIILAITPVIFVLKLIRKEKLSLKSSSVAFILSLVSYLFYVKVNGGIPTPRYIFPSYFLLVFFLFKELDENPQVFQRFKFMPYLLLILVLADSKLDKSFKRLKSSFSNRSESAKETVNKGFIYSKFWNYIETPMDGDKSYIVSDYLTSSYYAPKGIRVSAGMMDRKTSFIYSCPDVTELKDFDYALLKEENNNACYRKIKEEGIHLHTEADIALYDIRKLRL